MTDSCLIRWQLYANWQHSAQDMREQRKNEYSQHLRDCPICSERMTERRQGPANPELSTEQVNDA
jgi:hypothetical protein